MLTPLSVKPTLRDHEFLQVDKENHDDRPQTPHSSSSSSRMLQLVLPPETPSSSFTTTTTAAVQLTAEVEATPLPVYASSSSTSRVGRTSWRRGSSSEASSSVLGASTVGGGAKRRLLRDGERGSSEPAVLLRSSRTDRRTTTTTTTTASQAGSVSTPSALQGEDDGRYRTPSPYRAWTAACLAAWSHGGGGGGGAASSTVAAPRSLPHPSVAVTEILPAAPATAPPQPRRMTSGFDDNRRSECTDPVAWTLWQGGTEDWIRNRGRTRHNGDDDNNDGPPERKRSRAHSPPSAVRAVVPPQAARPQAHRLLQRPCLRGCF